jgi:integrase
MMFPSDDPMSEQLHSESSVLPAGQYPALSRTAQSDIIGAPPVQSRKRGKCMSRRTGQNPKVRVKKRSNGQRVFYFQYWMDVPGQEDRERKTHVIGPTSQMTKSEAERKKVEFLLNLELNSVEYQIPSSLTFANAVSHYRDVFAPHMLRSSTYSTADGHLRTHLEADWNDVPIEHITIDSVNEWIWKKRNERLSWITIKNILRTMQRVLSSFSKDKKPPFSQIGLAIPERDKLQMKVNSRKKVSFSWTQAERIADHVGKMETLGKARRERYSTLFLLAAASGLRSSELLALRANDIDFGAKTVRVEESSDQRGRGEIGPCKNATAYRTVLLCDPEGHKAMRRLARFLGIVADSRSLIFHSNGGGPLLETNILNQGLYPALEALGLEQAGLHAFRRGCNRRWELAGVNPAVIRQQMGHASAAMTALYTGEIPLEQIRNEFSMKFGNKIDVLETMETGAAA